MRYLLLQGTGGRWISTARLGHCATFVFYDSAKLAATNFLRRYPDHDVRIVDTWTGQPVYENCHEPFGRMIYEVPA